MPQASVRIRATGMGEAAPDRQALNSAADTLRDHGFEILRVGRSGVSIRGTKQVFARELGIHPVEGVPLVTAPTPASGLSHLVDLVEIAPQPAYFLAEPV